MVWLLLLPCIVCALISMSYDNIGLPVLGMISASEYSGHWPRLIVVAATSGVFLAFTFFANHRSFKFNGANRLAWFPFVGNLSLTLCDFVGNALDRPLYGLLTLPVTLALVVVTILSAWGSRSSISSPKDN